MTDHLTVFSVGYQGRKLSEMCESLVRAGVSTLLDVRQNPWSQRPEFRKGALESALAAHGIRYVHLRDAGNPFRPGKGEYNDLDSCARAYRAYLAEDPVRVERVAEQVLKPNTAVMCFESHHTGCHRGVLLEHLREAHHADFDVVEVMSPGLR